MRTPVRNARASDARMDGRNGYGNVRDSRDGLTVDCSSVDGPTFGLPNCSDLPLPHCTFKQYRNEVTQIQRNNAQFSGTDPFAMEEHLATDQGCIIGASMFPHSPPSQTIMAGAFTVMTFVFFAVFTALFIVILEQRESHVGSR